ncbi:MAG TPA: MFS transporter, partial [Clostridiales bacterium]|nr:MFS transporter [Clostridiales bacterium]
MNSTTLRPDDRLSRGEKLAFGLANLGNIPIMILVGTFLLIFYTDVVGLDPAAVATLFLVTRIIDGINDPIMGYLIDHLPRTRLGRFRTYLLIGAIVCAINYILLWFGPLWVPAGKLVVAYITYILIGITFDMMDIPLNSLIPAMTDHEKDRSSLSAIKGIFLALGGIAIGITAPLVIANTANQVNAYYILI